MTIHSPEDQLSVTQPDALIAAQGLFKSFGDQTVLHDVDASFNQGELSLITGASGSGKTTLLRCISGLERPDYGSVRVGGVELTRVKPDLVTRLRGKHFGFIFQDSSLLNGLTVADNVTLQHDLQGNQLDPAWLDHLYGTLGISDKLSRLPQSLSSGEQQRVGIVRALAHQPTVLFADEPTGALNSDLRHQVYDALQGFAAEGITTVVVSHDTEAPDYVDSIIHLQDGGVVNVESKQ